MRQLYWANGPISMFIVAATLREFSVVSATIRSEFSDINAATIPEFSIK